MSNQCFHDRKFIESVQNSAQFVYLYKKHNRELGVRQNTRTYNIELKIYIRKS